MTSRAGTPLVALIEELDSNELPEGFREVTMLVTEQEYQNLRQLAAVTGEGTVSAGLRRALKWHETPYGLKAALVRFLNAREGSGG